MKKVYIVVGTLSNDIIVEEFKLLREAIEFVRRKDSLGRLHIKRPNGTWVEKEKIHNKE